MMPGTIKTDSQVNINDSCNGCCCFQWKRGTKVETQKKVERQVTTINFTERDPLSKKIEHSTSHIVINVDREDDIVFVQDYSVPKSTLIPQEEQTDLFSSSAVIDPVDDK